MCQTWQHLIFVFIQFWMLKPSMFTQNTADRYHWAEVCENDACWKVSVLWSQVCRGHLRSEGYHTVHTLTDVCPTVWLTQQASASLPCWHMFQLKVVSLTSDTQVTDTDTVTAGASHCPVLQVLKLIKLTWWLFSHRNIREREGKLITMPGVIQICCCCVYSNNNSSHFCSAVCHWQEWVRCTLQDQQKCVY